MTLNYFFGPDPGDPRRYPYQFNLWLAFSGWLLVVWAPLVNVIWLCRVARRNAISWRWAHAAVVLIALVCAGFWFDVIQPANDHYIPDSIGNAAVVAGFGISSSASQLLTFFGKLTVAEIIGILLIKRAQRLQRIDEFREEAAVLRRAA
jgi:hypothetical protein